MWETVTEKRIGAGKESIIHNIRRVLLAKNDHFVAQAGYTLS